MPDDSDTDEAPDDSVPVTPAAILAEVARLFAARDAALAEDPPNRVEAATLEEQMAALLADVDMSPASDASDTDLSDTGA